MSNENNAIYTYDGNNHETFFILKNNRVIAEIFMGEDDAIGLLEIIKNANPDFEAIGSERSAVERPERNKIHEAMSHYLSNDELDYDTLIRRLKRLLKNGFGDLSLDGTTGIEVWEKVEGRFTVKEFCDLVGIK